MQLILPTQIAALGDAAQDANGLLRRRRAPSGEVGYLSDSLNPAKLHSAKAVVALAREGLLTEKAPGFQSVFVITEAGRKAWEANQRATSLASTVSA